MDQFAQGCKASAATAVCTRRPALSCVLRYLAVFLCALSVMVLSIGRGEASSRTATIADRKAAIVVDGRTGEVLYADSADEPKYPASLTKMMTLYMVFDALDAGRLRLEQRLPVSRHAAAQPATHLGLRAGSTIRVEDAILGLVTKSANDAAVVIAEALSGTEPAFAEAMTAKARALGMSRTVFRNASGLPDTQQRTTARDLAVLARALIYDHPQHYGYFARTEFTYGGRTLESHNRLMRRFEGMDGLKTGYIRASGFNLAASAVRDGRRLVAVVMGGATAQSRDDRMAELLEAGFDDSRRSRAIAVADARPLPTPQGLRRAAAAPVVPVPLPRPELVSAVAVAPPRVDGIGELIAANLPRLNAPVWSVQVGAFNQKDTGQRVLDRAARRLGASADKGRLQLLPVRTQSGTVWRARISGFQEHEAAAACETLRTAGQRCLTVAPDSGPS